MELDAQDLKRGLKFIVGTWQVDYVVNAWSNDLSHIPAAEFKSTDGNDLSAISYSFFEDHTMVMKDSATGKEEKGTWEQTEMFGFHYTLNGFLDLPQGAFLDAVEKLQLMEGTHLVFSLVFFASVITPSAIFFIAIARMPRLNTRCVPSLSCSFSTASRNAPCGRSRNPFKV